MPKSNWTEDAMQKALRLISRGRSQRYVERKFGIPRRTLRNRLKIAATSRKNFWSNLELYLNLDTVRSNILLTVLFLKIIFSCEIFLLLIFFSLLFDLLKLFFCDLNCHAVRNWSCFFSRKIDFFELTGRQFYFINIFRYYFGHSGNFFEWQFFTYV